MSTWSLGPEFFFVLAISGWRCVKWIGSKEPTNCRESMVLTTKQRNLPANFRSNQFWERFFEWSPQRKRETAAVLRSLTRFTRSNLAIWCAPRRGPKEEASDLFDPWHLPRSCTAHGQRDWQLLETSGRVASGVAEFVQKSERKSLQIMVLVEACWGPEGWAMSEMLHLPSCGATLLVTSCDILWHLVTSCDILWHLVWHLSGVVPFSYIQGFAHTGRMDWTSSRRTQIFDPAVSWCFWLFLARSTCQYEHSKTSATAARSTGFCCERIFPCCRWAWRGTFFQLLSEIWSATGHCAHPILMFTLISKYVSILSHVFQ